MYAQTESGSDGKMNFSRHKAKPFHGYIQSNVRESWQGEERREEEGRISFPFQKLHREYRTVFRG